MGISNTVHVDAMLNQYNSPRWNSKQFIMLISLREFGPDMQCMDLAMASLRLAWNISRKTESELSYHELLDVFERACSQVVWSGYLELSNTVHSALQTMFKIVFLERCEVIVNILYETLRCILSLAENLQTVFQVSTRHTRRIQ